jgi:hypothetical protein
LSCDFGRVKGVVKFIAIQIFENDILGLLVSDVRWGVGAPRNVTMVAKPPILSW